MISGSKTVEIRRTNLRLTPGQKLWIYSTVPVSKIEIIATVKAVHREKPTTIWNRFGSRVSISRRDFDDYVDDRSLLTAIELCEVKKLISPVNLEDLRRLHTGFHPPQLACYLEDRSPLIRALSRRK